VGSEILSGISSFANYFSLLTSHISLLNRDSPPKWFLRTHFFVLMGFGFKLAQYFLSMQGVYKTPVLVQKGNM
jgi:hypothetical protein